MPRINLEEKWWSDPRRLMLIGKIGLCADAAIVNAIRLSQEHSGEAFSIKGLLPDEWIDALLSVCLASGNRENFYLKGSKEHHKWILKQREKGKLGGLARSNKNNVIQLAVAKPQLSYSLPSSSSSSSEEKEHRQLASLAFDRILAVLNRKWKIDEDRIRLLSNALRSGLTVDDVVDIARIKRREWENTDMQRHIVFETLYAKKHRAKYMDQVYLARDKEKLLTEVMGAPNEVLNNGMG